MEKNSKFAMYLTDDEWKELELLAKKYDKEKVYNAVRIFDNNMRRLFKNEKKKHIF